MHANKYLVQQLPKSDSCLFQDCYDMKQVKNPQNGETTPPKSKVDFYKGCAMICPSNYLFI